MEELEKVKLFIERGEIDEAISLIDSLTNSSDQPHDELYYLKGNAFRKKGDWQQAINSYMQAIDLNPDSKAVEAKTLLLDILDFYHKDMYNP